MYSVKEIYYTLQGEGACKRGYQRCFCASQVAISGRAGKRSGPPPSAVSAIPISSAQLAPAAVNSRHLLKWLPLLSVIGPSCTSSLARPLAVCTGRAPLAGSDEPLVVVTLHEAGFEIALETNGTRLPPSGVDWITVSPKAEAGFRSRGSGNELKLVFPQSSRSAGTVRAACRFAISFCSRWMGLSGNGGTLRLAVQYCLDHPQWRLSLQTHKYIGIA